MVGLSVVLEGHRDVNKRSSTNPQVISKVTMTKPSSPLPLPPPCSPWNPLSTLHAPGFLSQCFLCKQKLLPGKDIYMYKGDRAFCSVGCRCKHIFMDEEESIKGGNCSWAAMKPQTTSSSSSSSSSRSRRGQRNGANGFAS